ncbi:vitamin B12 import ATP-binding protein BtuD [Candidatus Methanoplasma termitum]|uniref:BtuD2 protein n=1 Tax=Candidatus Methanoplasma termitum TaxID=1577791 RepID=A0A0A7LBQ0_9ARCH|nr:ATP-binding protein [Candidatus Methanoplasma termitum]AIZ56570.1 vitamin B12 import ATP-binding protein BtuD [Candidatus Methanoplasma termitum]MCL2333817.1 ATP-binding protein [Candidatus Methanoplasma sp.]
MMLKGFSIYGLFGEYSYEIDLSDSNITFIHSLNGYGKSTIMKLINDILKGNIDEVGNVNFERMDLRFDNGTALIVENDGEQPLLQMQKNELEEEIQPEDLKSILDVLYISPDRSIIMGCGELRPALNIYMESLMEKLRDAKEDNKLASVPKKGRKEYNDAELEFWSKDLKAKLDFMKRAGMEPDMPSGRRFPPTRFEIMKHRQDYEDLAFSVEEYINKYYELAESAIVYVDIVNDLLVRKNIYFNEGSILSVRMDNGAALPIDKLSSGEKQILIMFYLFLFVAKHKSLVIIDEPEISLHVAWQQSLGKTFSDIAKLRGLHVIVATHSPQVIHDKWDLSVELRIENDK